MLPPDFIIHVRTSARPALASQKRDLTPSSNTPNPLFTFIDGSCRGEGILVILFYFWPRQNRFTTGWHPTFSKRSALFISSRASPFCGRDTRSKLKLRLGDGAKLDIGRCTAEVRKTVFTSHLSSRPCTWYYTQTRSLCIFEYLIGIECKLTVWPLCENRNTPSQIDTLLAPER